MTRRAACLALCGVALSPRPARAAGFHITDKLTATVQESQEGYFACGKEVAIVTKPGSPIHDDLVAMVDTVVQISVFNPKEN